MRLQPFYRRRARPVIVREARVSSLGRPALFDLWHASMARAGPAL